MSSPKMQYKSFRYENSVTWTGNRSGTLESEGKPVIQVSSPPEFRGEEGLWSPEDLFVAAVNICLLTTFMAFALRKELPLESYVSSGEGVLERGENGYQFTKVILQPHIIVSNSEAAELAAQILHDAHDKCLISNSIRGEVIVEPKIEPLWS